VCVSQIFAIGQHSVLEVEFKRLQVGALSWLRTLSCVCVCVSVCVCVCVFHIKFFYRTALGAGD